MPKDYWNSIEEIKVPTHLDLDIIKGALYIHNADDKQQADDRINFLLKKLGDRKMTYVMALLMLPYLMEMVENSKEYKDYFEERKKRLN
jgi:hypothetical protein|tara:strand:- start:182 stop:448 length:267 start_codon:yes stop_codon:yes gene_type:complete